MAYVLPEVPKTIGAYFDEDSPLGPIAAEHVNDEDVSAYLVSIENDAFIDLSQGTGILFGRKGAGKSSLLNSFLFPNQIRTTSALSFETPRPSAALSQRSDFQKHYDLVVKIDASKELDAVHGEVSKHSLPGPEIAAEEWAKRLWLNVLWATACRPDLIQLLDDDLKQHIVKLSSLLQKLNSLERDISYFDEWIKQRGSSLPSMGLIVSDLRDSFIKKGVTILFLIDTIEEYDFITTALNETVAGLLYLVGIRKASTVHYKIAFPYEIYDSVQEIGNPEKINLQSTTIRWRSAELVRIVTRRMLLCLYLYENESIEELLQIYKGQGTSSRSANAIFWNDVFCGDIANEAYHQESALYYVLRHTQLLPRQLISSLGWLLKMSKTPRSSYRFVNHDIITDAMRSSCNTLIKGIESGFKFTYPKVRDAFERFLPRCDICMDFNELHKVYANSSVRAGFEYTESFYSFIRALLHMGVFGVVKETIEPGRYTDRYIEADFSYRDDTVLRAFDGKRFAMHPAFSLLYQSQERRMNVGKAVLPSGSVGDPR